MVSLFFRNFIFIILQPGVITVLIPYLILKDNFKTVFAFPKELNQYFGLALALTGLAILFYCISLFAIKGRGTLSPIDPTKYLVTSGLYLYSRNPMYIGVMLILLGETLSAFSVSMLIYSGIMFIVFNFFISLHEEPRLRNVFGEEYRMYCSKVRRWI